MNWKFWTERFWSQRILIVNPARPQKNEKVDGFYPNEAEWDRSGRAMPMVMSEFSRRGIAVHEARISVLESILTEQHDEKLAEELSIREAALANIRGY